ncbi:MULTISPECIES: phage repressor protein CI [Enterobacteriaceae]|uniref:phage repressor protein CI n=1 Tax=Enterobacteriaceae TaxID=543 RepID=UPI0007B3693A|nr:MULTISPECIES: phage repressor protein CI [Enterobacteriaceae]EGT4285241.1 phage repressor protein CI [Cronobacter sakazakii]HBD2338443.1 phage repressor protein CI [Escherichia coli]HEG1688444.1 phage repressor protein CI [Enterobacter cloacae]EGT4293504.1 phage repressor protein CI [Cronobacter sakazakii]EME1698406.1 phage repressor protein CI [Cronobacter sakazakii]
MNDEDLNTQDVIERISSAYGVSTQKALAEVLGVPSNSVSTWVQRNSFPGKAIIQCSLDTGADLNWLLTGQIANLNLQDSSPLKGKALYDEILASGGKPVLRRILDAYGFTMQKELGDLLDISSGTISTWVRRDFFPGDVVVTCALDTGVSLEWLATGKGKMRESKEASFSDISTIKKSRLESGELKDAGAWHPDPSMIPSDSEELIFVEGVGASWLVDRSASNLSNGRWLIDIDGALDVFDVIRLPGGKVRLSNKSAEFECNISDIKPAGSVVLTLEKHV